MVISGVNLYYFISVRISEGIIEYQRQKLRKRSLYLKNISILLFFFKSEVHTLISSLGTSIRFIKYYSQYYCYYHYRKTEGQCGTLLNINLFCVFQFLFIGYRLLLASLTFSEFQEADSNSCLSSKGGNAETKGEKSSNVVLTLGRVLVPC